MSRVILIAALVSLVIVIGTAAAYFNSVGPAPNAGDGIPDGSGF